MAGICNGGAQRNVEEHQSLAQWLIPHLFLSPSLKPEHQAVGQPSVPAAATAAIPAVEVASTASMLTSAAYAYAMLRPP